MGNNINPSSFALSQICAAGFSGGKNFGVAVAEFGTEMMTVSSTKLGALYNLPIASAEHARGGTALGMIATSAVPHL